jgi:hypothetical protein
MSGRKEAGLSHRCVLSAGGSHIRKPEADTIAPHPDRGSRMPPPVGLESRRRCAFVVTEAAASDAPFVRDDRSLPHAGFGKACLLSASPSSAKTAQGRSQASEPLGRWCR